MSCTHRAILGFLLTACCSVGLAYAQTEGITASPFPPSGTVNNRNYWRESEKSTYITQSEPASAVYGSHVVVGWNDFASYQMGGYNSTANWAVSHNGGATFTDALHGLPTYSGGNTITKTYGDPSIAVDPTTGYFYYVTMALRENYGADPRSAIAVYQSTDYGNTFNLYNFVPADNSDTKLDRGSIVIDQSGRIYVTYAYHNPSSSYYSIRSWNLTYDYKTVAADNNTGLEAPAPAVGPDDHLYITYRLIDDSGNPHIFISASSDYGAHFGTAVNVTGDWPLNGVAEEDPRSFCGTDAIKGNIRLYEMPSLAVDTRKSGNGAGSVYVAFNARNPVTGNLEVYLIRSKDGGATWSAPMVANARPAGDISDKFMPWIAVNRLGVVAVLYYDRRIHPNFSLDNSNSWITPYLRRFNSSLQAIGFDRLGNAFPVVTNNDYTPRCYMGDYNSISVNRSPNVVDNLFYVSWGDNGFGDPDVKFRKVAP